MEDQATTLINLEKLILSHLDHIDRNRVESKKVREMINDILANDPVYQEHNEKAKEASKQKSQTKQQILKRPEAATLNSKLEDFRTTQKELQKTLSNYLQEYQKLSGSNQIEDEEGTIREIVYMGKLIKRGGGFRP